MIPGPRSMIFLIGYRCTGKSVVGKILASLLDRPFIDTDRIIETQFNTTINQMVLERGWEDFRQRERQALFNTALVPNPVVATGGGIVLDPENCNFIQTHGFCTWLWADMDTIIQRILADNTHQGSRPMLTELSLARETQAMLDLRNPLYKQLAQLKINTTCHSPEQAAILIKERFSHVRF